MKATNRSKEQPQCNNRLYQSAGSSKGETVVFATLGLVAALTIGIAVVSGSIPSRPGEPQFVTYFRSGQMVADMRTATAVVHYLFEAEPAVATNERQKQQQAATNNFAVRPKV
jgi:hypothetical protein